MKTITSPMEGRLRGRAVLLSASIPKPDRSEIYRRMEAAEAIEEAVVSLARAIFSEGGTLVFGGHPTISPLIASVVGEYVTARTTESSPETKEAERRGPRVEIYQSKAYWEWIAESTQRLEKLPGVKIHWIEAVDGEVADPNVRDKPQAQKSLGRMRSEMVIRNDLLGMVCIGGMEGVEQEVKFFHEKRLDLPVYLFRSTGGAAMKLAEECGREKWAHVPEDRVQESVEEFWRKQQDQKKAPTKSADEERFAVPYAYVAQKVVAEMIG